MKQDSKTHSGIRWREAKCDAKQEQKSIPPKKKFFLKMNGNKTSGPNPRSRKSKQIAKPFIPLVIYSGTTKWGKCIEGVRWDVFRFVFVDSASFSNFCLYGYHVFQWGQGIGHWTAGFCGVLWPDILLVHHLRMTGLINPPNRPINKKGWFKHQKQVFIEQVDFPNVDTSCMNLPSKL